jgi:PAT family beta-lactamase induction signal transducer AmpG
MSDTQSAAAEPAAPTPPPERPTFLQSLAVFVERRSLVMLVLGFGAGLPNLMIFDTLSAWLRVAGLSLDVIAVFSLATLAYSAKFLWAPLVDRTRIPLLTDILGHRRSWMLVSQLAVMGALLLIATGNPQANLPLMATFAVLAGFAGATQDIVVDAWRIEAADVSRQGVMATAYQWGYRVAIIVAGAVPLFLSSRMGWGQAYGLTSALMLIAIGAVLLAPREAEHRIRPILVDDVPRNPARDAIEIVLRVAVFIVGAALLGSGLAGKGDLLAAVAQWLGQPESGAAIKASLESRQVGVFYQIACVIAGFIVIFIGASQIPGMATRPGVFFSRALGDPFRDFFGRNGGKAATLILAMICLYRISEFVLNVVNPFYLDLGFTAAQIAEARKVFGVAMSLLGVTLGGLSIRRLGLVNSLVIGAFAGPLSHIGFMALALSGPDFNMLLVAIGMDNIAAGYSGTALIAYMSSLTGEGFTATQYALFSSLYALPGKLLASQSGRIIESSARNADAGGLFAPLKRVFENIAPNEFARAMESSHVSPAALGAGYMTFFIYSIVIGVVGVILAFAVGARAKREAAKNPPADTAPA